MTETFIAHLNGSHACYVTETGVDRAFIGCSHDTPREAIAHTLERREDTDAIRDHLRVALDLTPGSRSNCLTSSLDGAEDSGSAENEAPDPDGPGRPAPTGSIPPAPVGAPSPEDSI